MPEAIAVLLVVIVAMMADNMRVRRRNTQQALVIWRLNCERERMAQELKTLKASTAGLQTAIDTATKE